MNLHEILNRYRDQIVREWTRRLQTEVSPRYTARPIEELLSTSSEATDANFAALVENEFSRIDDFVDRIAEIRSAAGFPLADVQKAFELYRTIVMPILMREVPAPELLTVLERLNDCLSHTLYRFSEYYRALGEKEFARHALNLEAEVRKRTRDLLQSEDKFRTLAENTTAVIVIIQDERFVYVNPAFVSRTGYGPDEIASMKYWDVVAPDMRALVKKRAEERRRGKAVPSRYDLKYITKSGEERVADFTITPIEFNSRPAFLGLLVDITDRIAMEQALRESERNYRNIFENAVEGIFQSSPEGRFLKVNPAMATMCGYSSPEDMVRSITDIGTQYYVRAEERAAFTESLASSEGGSAFEHRVYRKDGTTLWVAVSARAVRDKGGKLLYYEGTSENITKRKEVEEALKKSESLLRSVLSASPVGHALNTSERVIIWTNDALARISGYTPDELKGRSARIFYPSDEEFSRMGEIIYGDLRAGRIGVTDTKFLRKDGRVRDVQVSAAAIDAQDLSAGIVFAIADITERKRTEEELRKAHQRLSDIIDFLPDATFVIDRERRVVAWNKAIEEMTSVKKAEILGKGDYAYALPFYGEPRPIVIDLVFEENEVVEKTYDHVRREGDRLSLEVFVPNAYRGRGAYISATASRLYDRDGNIIGAIESIRDVTEQKRIEKALQESEERYRTAIESSNDGITIVKNSRHIYVNGKFLEIFGLSSTDEVVGKRIGLFVHPDDRDRVREISERRERNEDAPNRYEFRGLRKNGDLIYIEASVTRTTYQGEPISLAFLRDVSERKNLETQLLHAQKMEAIGTLAGGVAHDFNNILMALMGYTNLLQMKMDRSDPLRVYVDQILASIGKAANITQSLLAFGRKQVMEMKPYKVTTIVKDVEKLLRRLMPEDIDLTIELGDEVTILADMTQIDQVLINLATNARDAMPHGGNLIIKTGRVELGAEFMRTYGYGKIGPYALISVRDTGFGIDETTQKKIFEPFFTTKEPGKGTGLGLPIVYGIIKQHNGYITLTSRPGEGTTFHIYLPEAKEKARAARTATREAKGGTETLLLAEDNADIRRVMSDILSLSGYTVIEAANGREAVERFREHRAEIELLILDVVMPEKNGKEAYEEIRKECPDVRALFMSGYTGDVVLDKGVFGKAYDYVAKPIAPNELLQKVRTILDR